jgi:hypothetical protein
MSTIKKLITGGGGRKSRFHTESNELLPLAELKYLPPVFLEFLITRIRGSRPARPWWPMSVIPIISQKLSLESDVLEFGSGSSTSWLAKRSRCLVSIEDDADWAERTRKRLAHSQITSAVVLDRENLAYYNPTCPGIPDAFDLIIVDGSWRWKCIEFALNHLKPGGCVYLDNSDADKDYRYYPNKDMRHEAQKLLEVFASTHPDYTLSHFISFLSGELHVGKGTLLHQVS